MSTIIALGRTIWWEVPLCPVGTPYGFYSSYKELLFKVLEEL